MKKIIIAALLLSGCATSPPQNPFDYSHVNIVASTETRENPEYTKDFNDCNWYATSDGVNPARAAAGGALSGAAIASAFGLILGVNGGYGSLAGVGALSGAISGTAGAAAHNKLSDMEYKRIMVQCLRDKGYHVY